MVQFSTTLAPQSLSAVVKILGQLSPEQSLTSDANATLNVPAVDFSGVFWFQTKSTHFQNDTTNSDLKFHCISGNLAEINFGEAIVPETDIVTVGTVAVPSQKAIKQDIANWCTHLHLGAGAADLLDNEEELVADILAKDADLLTSMKNLLELNGGTPLAPRSNDPDSSTVDSVTTQANNYGRQMLLSGIANNAPEMIDRINLLIQAYGDGARVVEEFMPINPQAGDTLVLYAGYGSNNELRLGSSTGPIVSPALEASYLLSHKSANTLLFANASAPHPQYSDGYTGSAKAWRLYRVTITFT